jgi:hypothetical protein
MQLCQTVFTNLTTLSLSSWCLHDDCKVLLYMLKRSPNLEVLTLKLRNVSLLTIFLHFGGASLDIFFFSILALQFLFMNDLSGFALLGIGLSTILLVVSLA